MMKGSGEYAERFEAAKNVTASLKLARKHDQATNKFTGTRATVEKIASDSSRGKFNSKALELLNNLEF